MHFVVQQAPTTTVSFTEVVSRLTRHPAVEGLLVIGSSANSTFHQASDYDLVIVLKDAQHPWFVGVTTIDARFTDLLFVSQDALQAIAELDHTLPQDDLLHPVIRWLQHGQILFDRSCELTHAQHHVREDVWIQPLSDETVFDTWFGLNYNLAQARRMLQSQEPFYHTTVDIRMALYGHTTIWWSYFTLRKIVYTGEKDAIRYLQAHDEVFLDLYQHFITETDRTQKFQLYEQAARYVLAPIGDMWPLHAMVINKPDAMISP